MTRRAPRNQRLDQGHARRRTHLVAVSRDVEHERAIAIYDLVEENSFAPAGHDGGPYCLALKVAGNRLVFDMRTESGEAGRRPSSVADAVPAHRQGLLSRSARATTRRSARRRRSQIEAIDMGRRGLHNEGSELLMERLKDKIAVDFDTARRLFTLIAVLHWKG